MVITGILFYHLGKRGESDFFLAGRNLPWWLPASSVYATHTATGGTFFLYDIKSREHYQPPQLPVDLLPYAPTTLFKAMINPLVPYTIKGSIWYQGLDGCTRFNPKSKDEEGSIAGLWFKISIIVESIFSDQKPGRRNDRCLVYSADKNMTTWYARPKAF